MTRQPAPHRDIRQDIRDALAEVDAAALVAGARALMAQCGQSPEDGARLYMRALPGAVRPADLPDWVVLSGLVPGDMVYIYQPQPGVWP